MVKNVQRETSLPNEPYKDALDLFKKITEKTRIFKTYFLKNGRTVMHEPLKLKVKID